jgi:hypothetical protein
MRNSTRKTLLAIALCGIPAALIYLYWPVGTYSEPTSPRLAAVSDRVFSDGFEKDESGGPPVFSCEHPDVQPSWMHGRRITWAKMFTPPDGAPVPTYPNSNGFQVPIGADRSGWTAAEFIAGENQTVQMFWDPAQAKPNEGYFRARPAKGMFISISPCAGDLRASTFAATDYLAPGCRRYANTGAITTTTKATLSTFSYCALTPGLRYYITVSPVNPNDGLTPGEHSCSVTPSSADGCDAQAKSSEVQ